VSHEADTQIRTDIKIVNTYANATTAKIWLKNVGTARISKNELDQADVFIGKVGDFNRQSLSGLYDPVELDNNFWDQGETLSISISQSYSSGDIAYFSIVLPNGVRRSEEFGVTIPP
jgi:flagellar protein FlaG